MKPLIRLFGLLEKDQAKGGWSSLFAVASTAFHKGDSGAYVVPYAKIGNPTAAAKDPALALKLWKWTTEEFEKRGLLVPI